MRKKARALTFVFAVVFAIFTSVALDRLAGNLLNRFGYFTLMQPDKSEIYDTSEFTVEARISSQGIRNQVIKLPKPAGTYRILAVGDSFTFGWGVAQKDTWVRLLEQKLRTSRAKNIEIINAGAPGLGLDGIEEACEAYRDRFSVDAVIIGLYSTDDLYQAASTKQNQTRFDALVNALWPTLVRIGGRVIIDAWFTSGPSRKNVVMSEAWANWVKNYFVSHPRVLSRLNSDLRNLLLRGKINPSFLQGAAQDPEYIVKLLDEKNLSYATLSAKELLARIKGRCTISRPVLVIYLPSSETVSDFFFPYRSAFGFKVDPRLVTFRPDESIGKVAEDLGFSYLSLLPQFRAEQCLSCFYPWDIHMTALGNQKVADAAAAYILNYRLFTARP